MAKRQGAKTRKKSSSFSSAPVPVPGDADFHDALRAAFAGSVTGGPWAPKPSITLPEPPATPSTYRVRIDIEGARPPIWRRLDLAGDLTLDQVHHVTQSAFRWADCHLHQFTPDLPGHPPGRAPAFATAGADADLNATAGPDEATVRLDQVIADIGDRLFYTYDFGDSWDHVFVVESVLPLQDGAPAVCLDGRRAGPLEDSGGIWGYNDLVVALSGKQVPGMSAQDVADAREWAGPGFDPADAALEIVRAALAQVVRRPPGRGPSPLTRPVPRTRPAVAPVAPDGATALLSAPRPPDRSILIGNPRLAQAMTLLVDLAERAGALPDLEQLVRAADLDVVGEPPGRARSALFATLAPEEAEDVTRPWRDLVAAAGNGGLAVDGPGSWPAGTFDTADATLFADAEQQPNLAEAVRTAALIPAARTLHLLRRSNDRLVPTKAGSDAAGHPVRMWRHLADRVTRGTPEAQRLTTTVALLVIAGPDPARDTFAGTTDTLTVLGLPTISHRPTSVDEAFAASRLAWEVFEDSGCLGPDGRATDAGRRLARAALLSP